MALLNGYGGLLSNGFNICIDAANPEIWESLQKRAWRKRWQHYLKETMAQ
jgi:hypothetical protein